MLNNYAYQMKRLKCDSNCLLPRMALTLGVQEGRICELRRFTTAQARK